MARPQILTVGQRFHGGVNYALDPLALGEHDVRTASNARIDANGSMQTRGGSCLIHTGSFAANVKGGYSWNQSTGASQQLCVSNGTLYTGAYPLGFSWTSQVGALSASATPNFVTFRDGTGEVVYLADGGPLNKWTGAALSVNLAGTPNVSRLAVYNGRLFGISGSDETLYWSALNNGDTLGVVASGGGFATVRTFGGQRLINLCAVGSSLLLFHEDAISRFTGSTQDDIAIATGTEGVSSGTGLFGTHAVAVADNGVAFMASRAGLMAVTESGVQPVGRPTRVDPLQYSTRYAGTASGFGTTGVSHMVYHQPTGELLMLGWRNIDGTIWVYNTKWDAWTSWLPAGGPTCLWRAHDDVGRDVVLFGTATDVQQMDPVSAGGTRYYADSLTSSLTGGQAITMTVLGREQFVGQSAGNRATRIRRVTLETAFAKGQADGASLTLALTGGDSGSITLAASGTGTSGSGTISRPFATPKAYLQPSIATTNTLAASGTRVTLDHFTAEVQVLNRPAELVVT